MRSGQPIVDLSGDMLAALAIEGSPTDIVMRLTGEGLGIPRGALDDTGLIDVLRQAATDAHDKGRESMFVG